MSDKEMILTPRLQKSINSIIEKENFINFNVEPKLLPTGGGRYVGTIRFVKITGETQDGSKELNLFIKSIPNSTLTIYSISDAYAKEAFVYKDLFKMFHEVEHEFNIPTEEIFVTPKAYEESDEDSIILEDLTTKGFTTNSKSFYVSLEFAELAVQQLAKFHGLSIVIQKQRPKYFEEKVKTLKQPFFYGPAWNEFVENVNRLGLSCLDPEVRERVAKYLPNTYDKYEKYTTDPTSMRCLVHGDFRSNNIMIKYNSENKIIEALPIDYQLMFYGCPMIDLIYFIFGVTDQEFRRLHLEHIKNMYYETMGKYLKNFNMVLEDYYSRNEFERLWKERLDYGLMIALWFIPVTHADEGEIPDVTKINLADFSFNLNDVIRSKVRGIVDDFIQWGYI